MRQWGNGKIEKIENRETEKIEKRGDRRFLRRQARKCLLAEGQRMLILSEECANTSGSSFRDFCYFLIMR